MENWPSRLCPKYDHLCIRNFLFFFNTTSKFKTTLKSKRKISFHVFIFRPIQNSYKHLRIECFAILFGFLLTRCPFCKLNISHFLSSIVIFSLMYIVFQGYYWSKFYHHSEWYLDYRGEE